METAKEHIARLEKEGRALMLRTCQSDMTSYGGFTWPESGPVTCPDWSSDAVCGYGLHGLAWGEGDSEHLSFEPDARWLVVEYDARKAVDLEGKIKVPEGVVVFCGDRFGATAYLGERAPGRAIVGGTATAGYRGTATAGDGGTAMAGYRGTATAGYRGTAMAGDDGTAMAGDDGTATAGDFGTATAGYRGTATAGRGGILQARWFDRKALRHRIATAYVGEDGIEPNVSYHLDSEGHFVKAEHSQSAA